MALSIDLLNHAATMPFSTTQRDENSLQVRFLITVNVAAARVTVGDATLRLGFATELGYVVR